MAAGAFVRGCLRSAALAAALAVALAASAQEPARTVLLVARPGLPDPNFRESVVLVAQDESQNAVGVIINRPTQRSLASVLPGERFKRFSDPIFFGGPVAVNGLFALFRAQTSPGAAVKMLPDVYFAVHPATLEGLFANPPASIRFFTGYSGWAPAQLQGEVDRGDWYVLDADAETIFAKDMRGLWDRLVRKARSVTASIGSSAR